MEDGVTLDKATILWVAVTGEDMEGDLGQGNTCIGCSERRGDGSPQFTGKPWQGNTCIGCSDR